MARISKIRFPAAVAAFCVLAISFAPGAEATRLPAGLSTAVTQHFAGSRVRLDGSIETKHGELFLPVLPAGGATNPISKSTTVTVEEVFPEAQKPDMLLFSNGWCFLRVYKQGSGHTVISPGSLPERLRKRLLAGKLPEDLIVPEHVTFPKSLKPIIGDLSIPLGDDLVVAIRPAVTAVTPVQSVKKHESDGTVHGALFITSPRNGNLLILDEHTFAKIGEYPTEGIPSSMVALNGKLYLADQAKNRISIFDPNKRVFTGHIALLPKSAPKGLAVMPNGKFLYVSESGSNDVAVIELATEKVFVRTRVNAGPGRMAITPNGFQLVVLNPPAGDATIISTLNQRVLATVPVGGNPNGVIISSDSQRAYISNRMSNTVAVLDIIQRRVVDTFKTGTAPTGLALSPDGSQLFVANAKDNTIIVFDLKTKKQVKEIRLPLDVDFPGSLTFLPGGKKMIVSSESTDAIGILNCETLEFAGQQPVIGHTSDEVLWVRTD